MNIKNQNDEQKKNEELTRRSFLDQIALTALGGAALFIAGPKQAKAKVTKAGANYRNSPRGGRKCSNCALYQGSGNCAAVAGKVSANGFCRYYSG